MLDERSVAYEYDRDLGWFPIKNIEDYYEGGSRRIFVRNNDMGFRDSNHASKEKPRIAFLGDSCVWGYDVEQEERFTERLQELVPNMGIINLGVSGYGPDQEYLVLKKYFNFYRPDIVFLLFCGNDRDDDSNRVRYGGYYKPYFVVRDGVLALRGAPVPKSFRYYYDKYPFLFRSYFIQAVLKVFFYHMPVQPICPDPTHDIILAVDKFLKSNDAIFVVGFVDKDDPLRTFCKDNDIKYLDLENSYRYPSHGWHWTPEGHRYACGKIYNFLTENNFFNH